MERCGAVSRACVEFPSRLDTTRQRFSPAVVKHSYSEQHYEQDFLKGGDEKKNEVELDTEEGGARGRRRKQREKAKEKKKQQEQEEQQQQESEDIFLQNTLR